MKEQEDNKKNAFEMNTPLEYIGFGFVIVLIGGLFFSAYEFRSYETLDDWYLKFSEWALLPYVIFGGPFIVYGFIKLWDSFAETPWTKNLTVTAVGLAHWVAVPICINFSFWYSALAFIVICVAGIIIKSRSEKKKQNDNRNS